MTGSGLKSMLASIRRREAAGAEPLVREHILRREEMVLNALGRNQLQGEV